MMRGFAVSAGLQMPRLAEFATMEPIIRSAAYRESSACAKICAMFTAFVVALLLQASQPAPRARCSR